MQYFYIATSIAGLATGTTSRCSYKRIEEGSVVAQGMPEGVPLKRPSSYGGPSLKAIMEKEEDIQFGK